MQQLTRLAAISWSTVTLHWSNQFTLSARSRCHESGMFVITLSWHSYNPTMMMFQMDNYITVYRIRVINSTLCVKKHVPWCLIITSTNVDQISYFPHQFICKKILYVYVTKISISSAICCYITLWKSKIQRCYWFWQHRQQSVVMFLSEEDVTSQACLRYHDTVIIQQSWCFRWITTSLYIGLA